MKMNMNGCGRNAGAYLAGGLSAAEVARLEGHLGGCAECRRVVGALREMDEELMGKLAAGRAGGDFELRVVSYLQEHAMKRRLVHPMVKRAGVGIAALLLLGTSGVLASYVVQHDLLANPLTDHMMAKVDKDLLPASPVEPQRGTKLIQSVSGSYEGVGAANDSTVNIMSQKRADPGARGALVEVQEGQTGKFLVGAGIETNSGLVRQVSPGLKVSQSAADSGALSLNTDHAFIGGVGGGNGRGRGIGDAVLDGISDHKELNQVDLRFERARDLAAKQSQAATPTALLPAYVDIAVPLGAGSGGFTSNLRNGLTSATIAGVDHGYYQGDRSGEDNAGLSDDFALPSPTPGHGSGQVYDKPSQVAQATSKVNDVDGENWAELPEKKLSKDLLDQQKTKLDAVAQKTSDLTIAMNRPASQQVAFDSSSPPSAPITGQPVGEMPSSGNAAAVEAAAARKIIRTGNMDFEVVSFDDAGVTIGKIVEEEGGFVSSTSSEREANGKMRGSIVLRVTPEHLDRLVLKLRGLGDLKAQQIVADDVTKQYTDLESELKALRAIEERLLNLIKTGKGEVKDLVEAEEQLGEYRVKIEKIEGEIRFYNNQTALSTLTINLAEKDLRTPSALTENETVTAAIEAEDVDAKYQAARKMIEEGKGRIVESELRHLDAGELTGRIVCDVPPEQADAFVAGLKSLGTIARMERTRQTTAQDGTTSTPSPAGAVRASIKVEQRDVRFNLTLYNLANVAPREINILTIAVPNVEAAYRKVLAAARQGAAATAPEGGAVADKSIARVVTSSLQGQQPEQMVGDLRVDVTSTEAPAMLTLVRGLGEVMTASVADNPDTANATGAKTGIQVRLVSVASPNVPARETDSLNVSASDVNEVYNKLIAAVQGMNVPAAQIIQSQLGQPDGQSAEGTLVFEIPRGQRGTIEALLSAGGTAVTGRSAARSNDTASTLDSKVRYSMDITSEARLAPRRSDVLRVEVANVEGALGQVRSSVAELKGRDTGYALAKDASGAVEGHLTVDIPLGQGPELLARIHPLGDMKVNQVNENPQAYAGALAREQIDLTLVTPSTLVPGDKGIGATMRNALGAAVGALLWSLYWIVMGVVFVGPFLVVLWGGNKVWRRARSRVRVG